ncbi:MAG: phosphatidylglycerophosphatase A [candidate division WOR-3 bacterium]
MDLFITKLIATTFFSGYIPLAPGTWGSLLAVPLSFFLHKHGWIGYLAALGVIFLVGLGSADFLTKYWQKKDDARINIDEFLGMLITFFLLPRMNFIILVGGFILFRFFDIVKPLYIRNTEKLKSSLSIMLDDIVAGVYTNLLLQFLVRIL